MTVWILQTADDGDPLTFRLHPGTIKTVGRGPHTDLVLDRALVSREHCRLTAEDDALGVEDLQSTNGTFVNGTRVSRGKLKNGDTLRLGRVELTIGKQPDAAHGAG